MANTFEAAFMKLKNGMTLFFVDGKARELLDKLKALVATKYGPDNPPPAGNIWYATCGTATGTAAKTAATTTGDFVLANGSMVRILFSNSNNQTEPTLSVDGSTAKRIKNITSDNAITTNLWRAGEVIDVVYDSTQDAFIVVDGGLASTSYYGRTKLSNSTTSSSQTLAATSKAVKDLNDVTFKMETGTYPAIVMPDGSNAWIRVGQPNTSYGLLPSQAGSHGSGHNYLGTSSWYWKYLYADEIYGTFNGDTIDAAHGGTGVTSLSALLTALGLGSLQFKNMTVAANTTGQFVLSTVKRGLVICVGAGTNAKAAALFNINSSGGATFNNITTETASLISFTNAGDSTINVVNGTSSSCSALIFYV